MKLTRSIIGGLALAGTLALSGIAGFAQQGTTQGVPQQGGKEHGMGRHGGDHKGMRGDGDHKGGRGMRGGFGGRFGANLNLTDAQKEQMKQIAMRYHEAAKAQRQQRRGERRGGFDAWGGGTFNEAEVRAAAQARANAQVEREVQHARMMSEMYAVLTAEQKAQLATERQQREQKRQERRTRRNADTATPTSRT
ncbi:MAG TPA: Spy/CpxP family protein refolding chaperone [Pyrinomonadaceae bacterium]|nr:Spy/CpxP family protein refolding chaperone [Pyrinomonadaceae bacterium]